MKRLMGLATVMTLLAGCVFDTAGISAVPRMDGSPGSETLVLIDGRADGDQPTEDGPRDTDLQGTLDQGSTLDQEPPPDQLVADLTPAPDGTLDGMICPITCINSCSNNVCLLDCAGGCSCPSGWDCLIMCLGQGACSGAIDCTAANSCDVECGEEACTNDINCAGAVEGCTITCSGQTSCQGNINCWPGMCKVTCDGQDSCTNDIICGQAGQGSCRITCTGQDSCQGLVDCHGACACTTACANGSCGNGVICPASCPAGCSPPQTCETC